MKNPPDILSTNHGTIIEMHANTARGRRWIRKHVHGQQQGHVMAEHRYGVDILVGALAAGLRLQDTTTEQIAKP